MQRRTVAIAAIAVILLASVAAAIVDSRRGGDGASGTTPVTSMDQLAATYVATSTYATPQPLADLGAIHVSFDGDRVSVSTGCNVLGFTAHLESSRLVQTSAASMTEMGCEPARTAQQDLLAAAFAEGVRLELSGPYLSIHWGPVTNGAAAYSLGLTDQAWLASGTSTPTG